MSNAFGEHQLCRFMNGQAQAIPVSMKSYPPKATGVMVTTDMEQSMTTEGPILRIFAVRTKQGCADTLLKNFATTSADVVKGNPGNRGYFFGRCVPGAEDTVMFVSVWDNLDAVKARFGEDWQISYMPDGYEDLIDEFSVRHFDMGSGWHVDDL